MHLHLHVAFIHYYDDAVIAKIGKKWPELQSNMNCHVFMVHHVHLILLGSVFIYLFIFIYLLRIKTISLSQTSDMIIQYYVSDNENTI